MNTGRVHGPIRAGGLERRDYFPPPPLRGIRTQLLALAHVRRVFALEIHLSAPSLPSPQPPTILVCAAHTARSSGGCGATQEGGGGSLG